MKSSALSAKAQMIAIIEDQPDDSSADELLRELAFNRMISRGLEDIRSGQVLTSVELRRRIAQWQS